MIQFAQPLFLWALAGLTIPLGIHLLSRKEGKVVKMGSLRHLRETSTQQFKGIKLNELLLLALRCLLIVLFVAMLAGFQWVNKGAKRWALVEPGLENQQQVKTITDSLVNDGYEWRWLQPGFPLQKHTGTEAPNYWKIISELKRENLESVILFSQSEVKSFEGLRAALPGVVKWITIPSVPRQFVLQAVEKDNQILVRKGFTSSDKIFFESEVTKSLPDSVEVVSEREINITIVHDETQEQELKIIRASLIAIQETFPVKLPINEIAPTQRITSPDWVIWLSDSEVTDLDSVNRIVFKPQLSNELISRDNSKQWTINKSLTIDVARKENLTLQLASLLLADPLLANTVERFDNRALPDSIIVSGKEKTATLEAGLMPQTPNRYLIILFLLILVTERTIAYVRKQ